MSRHRKRWTSKEKLEILHYFRNHGSTKASREYGVSMNSIYKRRDSYAEHGETGLQGKSSNKGVESDELRRLRRENAQLKKIVAEKELDIRIQQEMLKKSL